MAIPFAKTARVMWLIALTWAACQYLVPWLIGSIMVMINTASGGRLDPYFAGAFYNLFIGPALMGGIAGYFTVAWLKSLPTLRSLQARTVVLVSMAALFLGIVLLFLMSSLFLRVPQAYQPAPGGPETATVQLPPPERNFVTGFFTWILPGLLIGLSIATEIERHGPKLTRRQVVWTAAGWGLGFAIGGGLGMMTRDLLYAPFLTADGPSPGGKVMELVMLLPDAINGLVAGLIGAWSTLKVIQEEITSPQPI